ncbi:MAG: prepilin-type N-terminal cleavage/methylation domain-containing protein [Candidatus Gracilibacteria bacterium]|nr:prepilin-type N-terminal cleavage/methylation domain-containing protein [Candidatus Gracilibacteria bacterium]MDD2909052.1 prepilin-type N-terminal cleavage/methylation domain-containing protein [Candidatus Gracilibacteria bacterium]
MHNSLKTKNKTLKINFGFTLVELLIAVTLSALLMTSVMIFTGANIRNSKKNEKILSNSNKNYSFETKLLEVTGNIDTNGIYNSGSSFGSYSSGIFLSTKGPNLPITFIGIKTFTGFCDSFSGSASATGTINRLVIKEMLSENNSHSGTTNYYINRDKNSIYTSGSILAVGTGLKGNSLSSSGTGTELNNPSAIIENSGILYIADSGNNRILSYVISTGGIYEIANNKNGISNPTDIYYSGALYITNAGAGNIIKITDGMGTGDKLDTSFKVPKNITFDKIEFIFNGIANISSPTSSGSFTFSGISTGTEDIVSTGTTLTYFFSGTTRTINSGTTYGVTINSISPYPTSTGSYSVKVNFLSGVIVQDSLNLPYFIKGDGITTTMKGNTIEVLSGGIIYPNNITSITARDSTITNYNSLLNNSFGIKTISELPIKDFNYNVDGNILSIKVSYYKYYDCLNEKHIIKEKIYKKLLK